MANFIVSLVKNTPNVSHVLVAPKATFRTDALSAHVNIERFLACNMTRNINPLRDFISLMNIIRIIKTENFDVLHLHSSKAGMLGRIASLLCAKKDTPIVYNPHGWSFHARMPKPAFAIFALLERLASQLCEVIVCVSNAELELGTNSGIEPRVGMVTIYNGIDSDRYFNSMGKNYWRKLLRIPESYFVYAVNARLAPGKSPLEVLSAFNNVVQRFPESMMIFIGDGPLRSNVENAIRAYGLVERVFVTGWVEDVRPYLWCADASILMTKWEAFGLAIVESLAAGLPCLAPREGPITEILDESTGVFAADIDDIQKIIEGMVNIRLASFHEQTLRDRARNFDARKMANQYAKLYLSLTTGNTR